MVNISVHMHRQGICAYLLHTINKHTSTYIAKELKMVLFVYIFSLNVIYKMDHSEGYVKQIMDLLLSDPQIQFFG